EEVSMKPVRAAMRSPALLFAALLLLLAASPLAGRAQPGAQARTVPSTLAGTWVHHGDRERAMRTIDAAFAPTISRLPQIMHGFARDQIRSYIEPPRSVRVAIDGQRVRVVLEASRETVIDGTLGARARTRNVESGTRVTPRLQGGWLELLYEGQASEMRQLFSTEPDGSQMHLDYTVTAPQISTPVRFRLEYVHP